MSSVLARENNHDDRYVDDANSDPDKQKLIQEMQFYDEKHLFSIPQDIAWGYLVLLTGGGSFFQNVGSGDVTAVACNAKQPPPLKDASLAYASLVDGCILRRCFGLTNNNNNTTASTVAVPHKCRRSWTHFISQKLPVSRSHSLPRKNNFKKISYKQKNRNSGKSFFCCKSSSSMIISPSPHFDDQLRKQRMNHTLDILYELRDACDDDNYYENYNGHLDNDRDQATDTPQSTAMPQQHITQSAPPHHRVIQAYIETFSILVRYHNQTKRKRKTSKTYIKSNSSSEASEMKFVSNQAQAFGRTHADNTDSGGAFTAGITSKLCFLSKSTFTKKSVSLKNETYRQEALHDINLAFVGLREIIAEKLGASHTVDIVEQ